MASFDYEFPLRLFVPLNAAINRHVFYLEGQNSLNNSAIQQHIDHGKQLVPNKIEFEHISSIEMQQETQNIISCGQNARDISHIWTVIAGNTKGYTESRIASLLDYTTDLDKTIFILSETHAPQYLLRCAFQHTKHVVFASIDASTPKGSGVGVSVPRTISSLCLPIRGVPGYCMCLPITGRHKLLIFAIYWPHHSTTPRAADTWHRILNFIQENIAWGVSRGFTFIFGGDFNANKPIGELSTHDLHQLLISNSMIDAFEHFNTGPGYTFVTPESRSRIDFIYYTAELMRNVKNCSVLETQRPFDHNFVELKLELRNLTTSELLKMRLEEFERAKLSIPQFEKATEKQKKGFTYHVDRQIINLKKNLRNDLNIDVENFMQIITTAAIKYFPTRRYKSGQNDQFETELSDLISKLHKRWRTGRRISGRMFDKIRKWDSVVTRNHLDNSQNLRLLIQNLTKIRNNKIEQHIREKRMQKQTLLDAQILDCPATAIRHSLKRYANRIEIDCVQTNSGEWISEPSLIKSCIDEQARNIFRNPIGELQIDTMTPKWQAAFAPISGCDLLMKDVWAPPSYTDFVTALSQLGRKKCPGISGVTAEMLKQAGKLTKHFLFDLILEIHRTGIMPSCLNTSKVIYLPKSQDPFAGRIDKLRPICLLETIEKLFCKIFFDRINLVLSRNNLLSGAGTSVLKNTGTSSSLLGLATALTHAKLCNKETFLFLEDKSGAYDTVTASHVTLSLRRLGIPEGLISFYDNLMRNRTLRINTKFGMSNGFTPERGIPQGGCESPLIFIISYDVGLTVIQNTNPGLNMFIEIPKSATSFQNLNETILSCNLKHTSYVDDLCIFGDHILQLQTQVDTIHEFNCLVGFRTNPSKSKLVVLNAKQNYSLKIGDDTIEMSPEHEQQRLLGLYFDSTTLLKRSEQKALKIVKDACRTLKPQIMSPARLKYILERVIYSAAGYLCYFSFPNEHTILQINRSVRTCIRKSIRVSKDFPSAILHSKYFGNLLDFESIALQVSIGELLVQLQPKSKIANSRNFIWLCFGMRRQQILHHFARNYASKIPGFFIHYPLQLTISMSMAFLFKNHVNHMNL